MLVICALLFCNANAVVEAKPATATSAKIPTALTISAPPSAQVRQSFSITGQLTANGAPCTKQVVYLQRLGGTTWTIINAQYVSTGTYSFQPD